MSGLAGVQSLFDGESQLVPGALRGFRTWAGLSHDGRLMSTGMVHQWAPAPFEGRSEQALCLLSKLTLAHEEPAPGRDCPCGLYGWYVPDDTRIVTARIVGVVQATGRVVLGSHGFRAERLEVLGVTSMYADPLLLRELRRLGFPVFESRQALLAAFPPDDVSALVDHVCDSGCEAQAQAPLVVSLHGVGQTMQQLQAAVQQIAGLMASQGQHAFVALQALAAAADGNDDEAPVVRSLRQRALDAVRNRGTGPRPRPRAPRSLGVGGKP